MKDNCWIYKGECLQNPPEGYIGYVYKITLPDNTYYYGKKVFFHKKKRALTQKEKIGTRKRIKIEQIDSKWLNYYGSNKNLILHLKTIEIKEVKREILMFCKLKTELSYWEAYYLFTNNVLFDCNSWNSNILGRFFKGKIQKC